MHTFRSRLWSTLLSLALVAALGCGAQEGSGGEAATTGSPSPAGEWSVVEINGERAPEGLSLAFEEGTVGGFSGCNNFNAGWSVNGELLEIGPAAATRKACPELEMGTELRFLEALGRVDHFYAEADMLVLFDATGAAAMMLRRSAGEAG